MDGKDGILLVVLAREQSLDLERAERLIELLDPIQNLRLDAVVRFLHGHLPEEAEVREAIGIFTKAPEEAGDFVPLADNTLGALLIVPKARLGHPAIKIGEASLQLRDVKDAPGGHSAACRAH
jgi:hypothetical protein